jgi:ABC-type oligopeptide transport system ATPase subunit
MDIFQEFLMEPEENEKTFDVSSKMASVSLCNIKVKCREDKINLDINEGDIVSIVGSVGTGKVGHKHRGAGQQISTYFIVDIS